MSQSFAHLSPIEAKLPLDDAQVGRVWFNALRPSHLVFHRHAELEANLVSRGHAIYLVAERRVRLVPGDLLWLFPAQNHVILEQSDDFAMWIAVWRPWWLRGVCTSPGSQMLLLDQPPETLHRSLTRANYEFLEALCERVAALDLNPQTDHRRNGAFSFLLFELWSAFEQGEAAGVAPLVHPSVERAARLLRDSNPPPGVPALARQVGLSPSRLSRLFAAQTGQNLSDFRARQCLQRALRLCEETPLSLSEIAARAGFGSYAQFHRVFRAQVGQSPAKHRASRAAT